MSSSTSHLPHCNTCKKTASQLSTPLSRCRRCQITNYCSHVCELADWKDHRMNCVMESSAIERGYRRMTMADTERRFAQAFSRKPAARFPRYDTQVVAPISGDTKARDKSFLMGMAATAAARKHRLNEYDPGTIIGLDERIRNETTAAKNGLPTHNPSLTSWPTKSNNLPPMESHSKPITFTVHDSKVLMSSKPRPEGARAEPFTRITAVDITDSKPLRMAVRKYDCREVTHYMRSVNEEAIPSNCCSSGPTPWPAESEDFPSTDAYPPVTLCEYSTRATTGFRHDLAEAEAKASTRDTTAEMGAAMSSGNTVSEYGHKEIADIIRRIEDEETLSAAMAPYRTPITNLGATESEDTSPAMASYSTPITFHEHDPRTVVGLERGLVESKTQTATGMTIAEISAAMSSGTTVSEYGHKEIADIIRRIEDEEALSAAMAPYRISIASLEAAESKDTSSKASHSIPSTPHKHDPRIAVDLGPDSIEAEAKVFTREAAASPAATELSSTTVGEYSHKEIADIIRRIEDEEELPAAMAPHRISITSLGAAESEGVSSKASCSAPSTLHKYDPRTTEGLESYRVEEKTEATNRIIAVDMIAENLSYATLCEYDTRVIATEEHSAGNAETKLFAREAAANATAAQLSGTAVGEYGHKEIADIIRRIEDEEALSAAMTSYHISTTSTNWETPETTNLGTAEYASFSLGQSLHTMPAEPQTISPSSSEDLLDITGTKAWLSSLSHSACNRALIDAYRLRIEDECSLTGQIVPESLYAGDFPLTHFMKFLELAYKEGVLPEGWGSERSMECQQVALDEDGDACILYAVDAEALLEKYWDSDVRVVEVLRILAAKCYGKALFKTRLRFFEGDGGWWG